MRKYADGILGIQSGKPFLDGIPKTSPEQLKRYRDNLKIQEHKKRVAQAVKTTQIVKNMQRNFRSAAQTLAGQAAPTKVLGQSRQAYNKRLQTQADRVKGWAQHQGQQTNSMIGTGAALKDQILAMQNGAYIHRKVNPLTGIWDLLTKPQWQRDRQSSLYHARQRQLARAGNSGVANLASGLIGAGLVSGEAALALAATGTGGNQSAAPIEQFAKTQLIKNPAIKNSAVNTARKTLQKQVLNPATSPVKQMAKQLGKDLVYTQGQNLAQNIPSYMAYTYIKNHPELTPEQTSSILRSAGLWDSIAGSTTVLPFVRKRPMLAAMLGVQTLGQAQHKSRPIYSEAEIREKPIRAQLMATKNSNGTYTLDPWALRWMQQKDQYKQHPQRVFLRSFANPAQVIPAVGGAEAVMSAAQAVTGAPLYSNYQNQIYPLRRAVGGSPVNYNSAIPSYLRAKNRQNKIQQNNLQLQDKGLRNMQNTSFKDMAATIQSKLQNNQPLSQTQQNVLDIFQRYADPQKYMQTRQLAQQNKYQGANQVFPLNLNKMQEAIVAKFSQSMTDPSYRKKTVGNIYTNIQNRFNLYKELGAAKNDPNKQAEIFKQYQQSQKQGAMLQRVFNGWLGTQPPQIVKQMQSGVLARVQQNMNPQLAQYPQLLDGMQTYTAMMQKQQVKALQTNFAKGLQQGSVQHLKQNLKTRSMDPSSDIFSNIKYLKAMQGTSVQDPQFTKQITGIVLDRVKDKINSTAQKDIFDLSNTLLSLSGGELPVDQESVKQLKDMVTKKVWNAVGNDWTKINKAIALYFRQNGYNRLADFSADNLKFYGSLVMLLLAPVAGYTLGSIFSDKSKPQNKNTQNIDYNNVAGNLMRFT